MDALSQIKEASASPLIADLKTLMDALSLKHPAAAAGSSAAFKNADGWLKPSASSTIKRLQNSLQGLKMLKKVLAWLQHQEQPSVTKRALQNGTPNLKLPRQNAEIAMMAMNASFLIVFHFAAKH